jgi:broad specificity phosphatase PhoE
MSIPAFPFYYLRHGETDWNIENRIMGHQDIPLNKTGIEQSRQLKSHLKSFEFERIWSSPLKRARQTAEIINESNQHPIDYLELLMERKWGVGEGKSHQEFLPDMKLKFKGRNSAEENLPEGAESYSMFEARVIKAFQTILVPSRKPPLVVGHGGVYRILTTLLAEASLPANNCSLYFFKPPAYTSCPWFIVNLSPELA